MEREIKFRAWIIRGELGYAVNEMSYQESYILLGWKWEGDTEMELMQFAGMKDKKGKDIYEGDVVVSFRKNYEDSPSVNKCVFKKGCFRLICQGKNDIPLYNYDSKHLEIIGNIYENPELLK